jgi:hypothetical protein
LGAASMPQMRTLRAPAHLPSPGTDDWAMPETMHADSLRKAWTSADPGRGNARDEPDAVVLGAGHEAAQLTEGDAGEERTAGFAFGQRDVGEVAGTDGVDAEEGDGEEEALAGLAEAAGREGRGDVLDVRLVVDAGADEEAGEEEGVAQEGEQRDRVRLLALDVVHVPGEKGHAHHEDHHGACHTLASRYRGATQAHR